MSFNLVQKCPRLKLHEKYPLHRFPIAVKFSHRDDVTEIECEQQRYIFITDDDILLDHKRNSKLLEENSMDREANGFSDYQS
jgi:hypothetical protein